MNKRIVSLEYEIKVAGGDVLESSATRGPLRFVSGTGQLLPALEQRIAELKPGEEASGVLPARQAFGDVSALPTKQIPRSEFPKDDKLEAGRVFEARSPDGGPIRFEVVKVGAEQVEVRFLHALHDKDIAYRVKVLALEDASRPPALPFSAADLEEVEE